MHFKADFINLRKVRAWMSYFTPLFYVDVYRIPNTDTGLANFIAKEAPGHMSSYRVPKPVWYCLCVFAQIAKSDANIWYINKRV